MKCVSCFVFVLSSLLYSTAFAGGNDISSADTSQATTAQAVIDQVKQALSDAQTQLARENLKNLPPLKQVDLALQTVITEKAGGGFNFWIISIGGTWQKDRSQELDITLVPPSPGGPKQISTASLTETLVQSIVSAAQGINTAGNGNIPLKTSSVVLKISFTVKLDGNAEIKTPQLLPITANATGDLAKTAVQTLTLTFGKS